MDKIIKSEAVHFLPLKVELFDFSMKRSTGIETPSKKSRKFKHKSEISLEELSGEKPVNIVDIRPSIYKNFMEYLIKVQTKKNTGLLQLNIKQ